MIDQEKQKERLIQAEAKYKEWTKEFLNTHCEYKADMPFDMNFIIAALWLKITDTVEDYINLQAENARLHNELTSKVDYIHEIVAVKDDFKAENEELKKRCNYIWAIGCDYDGLDRNSAKDMRKLVYELVGIASSGVKEFDGKTGKEILPRYVKLNNLKAENERLKDENLELLKYGNQKYEDTINEFLDCLINAAAIPSCAADKFHGWYDREIAETEKRVAKEILEKIIAEFNKYTKWDDPYCYLYEPEQRDEMFINHLSKIAASFGVEEKE